MSYTHAHAHTFYTLVIRIYSSSAALSPQADMHTMHMWSQKPSRVLNTHAFAKLAVRGTEVKACELGTETVSSTVQLCPQACLLHARLPASKMSLFLRKKPGFMSTLLSALTCQLGRASPDSPLYSTAVITPLRIHSKSWPSSITSWRDLHFWVRKPVICNLEG